MTSTSFLAGCVCLSATLPIVSCVLVVYAVDYPHASYLWCIGCAFYANAGYKLCLGRTSIFLGTSLLHNHSLPQDFDVLLFIPFCLSCLLFLFLLLWEICLLFCFFYFFLSLWGWGLRTDIVHILSPSLEMPTFYNYHNN